MQIKALKQNFLYSAKELKLDFDNFVNFLKNNKLTVILCWFFLLLAYGIKLFWYSIGMDTELALCDFSGTLVWWSGINRIGLVITKKLLRLIPLNVYVANFLTICMMFVFLMLFSYVFYSVSKKFGNSPKCMFVLPCVFITHPLFAEQFDFVLQNFEVSFAIALMFLSAFFITKWIFDSKNILHLIIGVTSLAWAFASYQAIAFLYISSVLAIYIYAYVNNLKSPMSEVGVGFFRKMAIKYVSTFIVGFVSCSLVNKVFQRIYGTNSAYTDNIICWGKEDFFKNVKSILSYGKLTLLGDGLFYSKIFIIVTVMALIYFFKFLLHKKHTNKILYILSFLSLMASPYFLSIVLGRPLIPRMQECYQFLIAFILYVCVQEMYSVHVVRFLIPAFSLYLSFSQGYKVAKLMYTGYMNYQSEVAMANKISERISMLNAKNKNNIPLVFVGNLPRVPNTPVATNGEVINLSFFMEDQRALGFMKTIGYSYKEPTEEECIKARKIAEAMPCWPNSGAVKYEDGVIIVKLSNN